MADFKYIEKQEKNIEKKKAELTDKTKYLLHESKLKKIKDKYKELLNKKKSGKLGWEDEALIEIYGDAIKIEEKDY